MGFYAPIENKKPTNRFLSGASNNLLVLGATFAGVAFGVLLSVALMRPMVHAQVASATKELRSQNQSLRALMIKPASVAKPYIGCAVPPSGHTLGAQTTNANLISKQTHKPQVTPPHQTNTNPGRGAGGGSGNNGGGNNNNGGGKTVVIKKIIGAMHTKTIASNKNTGYGSTNTISTTNINKTKVENDNDILLTNNNPQSATSGQVISKQNTTAGNAISGTAANTSKTTFDISVNNGAGAN